MEKLGGGVMTTNDIDNEALRHTSLGLLETIYQSYPEGLLDAVDDLNNIIDFYRQRRADAEQLRVSSQPVEMELIKGRMLPATMAPPIVLDFD